MTSQKVISELDRAAEEIRVAEDYYSRQVAIDRFRTICRDEQSGIDSAWEAAKRSVALVNQFSPVDKT
jgi:hypothetical protein